MAAADSVTSGSVWRAEAGDDKRAVAEDEAWMYVKMGTRDASEGNGASRYYSRDERSVERGAPAHIERAAAEEDEPWLYIKIGSRDAPEGNEA